MTLPRCVHTVAPSPPGRTEDVVTATRPLHRLVIALCTSLLLLAACSSDSGDDSAPAGGVGADQDAPGGGDGPDDEGADDGDDQGGDDEDGARDSSLGEALTGIVDAAYATGTAHVEVSGDIELSVDYATGGGFTNGGASSLSFSDTNNGVLGIVIDAGGERAAITFGTAQVGSGGAYPDTCDLGLTKNDDAGVAGRFRCEGVAGVDGAQQITVTLEGEFSVSV
jgi:hypothetical protein